MHQCYVTHPPMRAIPKIMLFIASNSLHWQKYLVIFVLLDRSQKMLSRNVCSIYPKCRGTEYFGNKATYFWKNIPPCVQFKKEFCFLPKTFFIDKNIWSYLYCWTGLKKCCPEIYVAFTKSVEEQSISKLLFYLKHPPMRAIPKIMLFIASNSLHWQN